MFDCLRFLGSRLPVGGASLLLSAVVGLSAPIAYADPVDLSPTPPDLTTSVAPNIALTFDDSGSMSFGYMPDGYTSCSWRYAWIGYNQIYYDPQVTYLPPLKSDGSSFPDVSFNAAPLDGYYQYLGFGGSTTDLAKKFIPTKEWDRHDVNPHLENSMGISCVPSSVKTNKGTTNNPNWESHAYYALSDGTIVDLTKSGIGATVDGVKRTDAAERQNFANWYSYYRTRNLMTKTAISRAFGSINSDIRMIWQTIWPYTTSNQHKSARPWSIRLDSGGAIHPFKDSFRDSFFDWLFKLESAAGTPDRLATIYASRLFEIGDNGTGTNNQDATNPYWNGATGTDFKNLSCRRNFHILVTDGYWNEGDGEIAERPALSSMDQSIEESSIYWNVSGGTDNQKSLAAIAYHYWYRDLAPSIDDKISPYLQDSSRDIWNKPFDPNDPWANQEVYFNPRNDPATWQHVSQYVVTLGIDGERQHPTDYDALRKGTLKWPLAVADQASALDDMWRAAVVSRGEYFSASNPMALASSLSAIIQSVAARTAAGVAGSLNTTVLNSAAASFLASYNTSDWSGNVQAQGVDEDGGLTGVILSLGNLLDGRSASDRLIATSRRSGSDLEGTPFTWSLLDSSQKLLLNTRSNGVVDANGPARLDWLRGDRSKEGALMRTRGHLLGAVINSQPEYVAGPDSGFWGRFPTTVRGQPVAAPENDESYQDFVEDHDGRKAVVYVAANDGMLHAFDASQDDDGNFLTNAGKELWAYVPNTAFDRLSAQSEPQNFQFVPTVDGALGHSDVFFSAGDKKWHTILVGSLRLGGRGIFALDITDPTAGSEAAVASKFLWEFSATSAGADADDPSKPNNPANLGFTYGRPYVARLANGKWVVLVSSGYFPDCNALGHVEPCDTGGKAAQNKFGSLFVLDAETGKLIRELRTKPGLATSSGLASPVMGDYNADYIDDVAFAGDLNGNLWRFDLSSTNVSDWDVNLVYKGNPADQRPITVMPRLFPDPKHSGFMVVVGTGKYLGLSDRVSGSDEPVQVVMGIREPGTTTDTNYNGFTNFVQQTLSEQTMGDTVVRGLTKNPVAPGKNGWYFELPVNGERAVVTPGALFNSNRAIVSTVIPGDNDPCDPSRKGSIMVVDAVTGGAGGMEIGGATWGTGIGTAGARVENPPVTGMLPVATPIGGGKIVLPGITLPGAETMSIQDSIWRRRSWSPLRDE